MGKEAEEVREKRGKELQYKACKNSSMFFRERLFILI